MFKRKSQIALRLTFFLHRPAKKVVQLYFTLLFKEGRASARGGLSMAALVHRANGRALLRVVS
jgi:hypothetical protein